MIQNKIKNNCLFMLIILSGALLLLSVGCKKMEYNDNAEIKPAQDSTASITANRVTVPVMPAVNTDTLTNNTFFPFFKPARWMESIKNNVKISHLSIPGTRWSAKYQTATSSQYQTKSISQQLNMGVRYLQISCAQNQDGTLHVVTSNSTSIPLSNFVDTVKAFLSTNPGQAVIILVEQADPVPPYPEVWASKIKDIVDANPQYFYKWPNYYSAASSSVADWPDMGQVRNKMMLLSHSDLLKSSNMVRRILQNTKINLGWTSNGNATVNARMFHQYFNTTGSSKVDVVYDFLVQADTTKAVVDGLCLNETGIDQTASSSIKSDANIVNDRVDDMFEMQYTEYPNYGRFGIVAMNYLNEYTSKLIYLTNFNRVTKKFKTSVFGNGAFAYNTGYDIPDYPIPRLSFWYSETPAGSPDSYSFPPSVWNHFPATDWMSKIPNNTSLSMMNIPGTHNAGTSTGSLLGKCQDWTIAQQLDNGVRFLDLRLKYIPAIADLPARLKLFHGAEVYNIYWDNVLKNLTDFLAAHPTETIILQTTLGYDSDQGNAANSLFQTAMLGKTNYFWTGSSATTTWPKMGDLRGKILLLGANRGVQYGSIDWSEELNSGGAVAAAKLYTFSGTGPSLLGYAQTKYTMEEHHYPTGYNNKWNLIQNCFDWAHYDITIDQYNRLYLNYTSLAPPTPRASADDINPRLRTYMNNEFAGSYDTPRRSGIYAMDFADWALTSSLYLTNFSRTQIMNSF